jgi:hypothetical protein
MSIIVKLGPDNKINWTENDIKDALTNKLFNKKIEDETMLMHAIKTGNKNLAEILIREGADTGIGDKQQRTPLWLCTIFNRADIAKMLINNGAALEERIGYNSPLYNAIKHDNTETTKVLIELGANPNIINRDHQTPLHVAVFRKNYEIVKLLLANGVDYNIKSKVINIFTGAIESEQTPLEMAIQSKDEKMISIFTHSTQKGEKEEKQIEKLNQQMNDNDKKYLNEISSKEFFLAWFKLANEEYDQKLNLMLKNRINVAEYDIMEPYRVDVLRMTLLGNEGQSILFDLVLSHLTNFDNLIHLTCLLMNVSEKTYAFVLKNRKSYLFISDIRKELNGKDIVTICSIWWMSNINVIEYLQRNPRININEIWEIMDRYFKELYSLIKEDGFCNITVDIDKQISFIKNFD